MSNLGWYQVLTIAAKKVGGPKRLVGLLVGVGAIIGAGAVEIKDKTNAVLDKKKRERESAVVYSVCRAGKSNEGLEFKIGDSFKVLEVDGDAALIEIMENNNNPYFVSVKFLETISDYRRQG